MDPSSDFEVSAVQKKLCNVIGRLLNNCVCNVIQNFQGIIYVMRLQGQNAPDPAYKNKRPRYLVEAWMKVATYFIWISIQTQSVDVNDKQQSNYATSIVNSEAPACHQDFIQWWIVIENRRKRTVELAYKLVLVKLKKGWVESLNHWSRRAARALNNFYQNIDIISENGFW